MGDIDRRRFMSYSAGFTGACLTGSLGVSACKRKKEAVPEPALSPLRPEKGEPKGPRYVVQILLSGGHDVVYTTDPKERAEVEVDIDLPEDNQITDVNGVRLGAHWAPLQKHADKLAILNGVQVGTANHDTGVKQFSRLKTRATDVTPGILDIIGTSRDTQALGAVHLSTFMRVNHGPKFFGTSDSFYYGEDDIFTLADRHKQDAPLIATHLRGEARRYQGRRLSGAEKQTLDNLLQAAAFFDRVPGLPTFVPSASHPSYTAQSMSNALDRTFWLLKNDLSRTVYVDLGLLGWDTHIRNAPRQEEMNRTFVASFSRFLNDLELGKNQHGNLLDNSLIVAGSDMGRFPRLNAMNGKDHLPQTSFFFAGKGIQGGRTHGQTDRVMKALPMSLRTGKAETGGHIPVVDDVGTTLLRACGFDPQRYGYAGRTIECLLS